MKVFILAFVLFLNSVVIFAQDITSVFGIKASCGISNLTDGNTAVGPRLGLCFGGLNRLQIDKSFEIQSEILISFKGATSQDSPEYHYSITYLEIPIMARYRFDKNSLYLGPYIGIKLNANLMRSDLSVELNSTNSTDFGISVGYERLIKEHFSADVRLNYGITKVFTTGDIRNISLLFGLSYYL